MREGPGISIKIFYKRCLIETRKFLIILIMCSLTQCSTLFYSYYSRPAKNAIYESESIISYEEYDKYYLATTKSVFQHEEHNLIIAVQVHNIRHHLISAGAFCLPVIPFFGWSDGYNDKFKYVDIIIGFKKKNLNESIYFNACDVNVEIYGKDTPKPELYADIQSLKNIVSYDKIIKMGNYPYTLLNSIPCKEHEAGIEIKNDTKYIIRFMVNLTSKNKIAIQLPDIIYKKQTISIPKIEFEEDSEFTYKPMFM